MRGSKKILLALPLLALGLLAFFLLPRSADQRRFADLPLDDQYYSVILSETPAQIKQGLSYRESIGADGMLFLFERETQPVFWMYEMRFPLDFIWIRNNEVVDIQQNVQPPRPETPDSQIARVQPNQPVTAVLEVPAGFIEKKSIKIGTRVGQLTKSRFGVW